VQLGEQVLLGERIGHPGVTAFKGIPFAQPPVGIFRWRAPQPLQTTATFREARKFAPACMQSMRIL